MGQSTFPAPSTGASYSSQPPANASSVLLDGSLVNSASYSTTLTGTGASWLLYANGGGTTTITVAGTPYTVTAGSTVGTVALTGSKSVTIATTYTPPSTFTASTMPSSSYWTSVTYGNGYYVAVQAYGTTAGAYSTNGTSWTASTMPSASTWVGVTYGNGYFVAIANGPTTAGAYSTNGTTWTASTLPSSANWNAVTYGNGYFVAVAGSVISPTTAGAYFAQTAIPVTYGIYNGPTATH